MKIKRGTITNTVVYILIIILLFIVLSCIYSTNKFIRVNDNFINTITSITDIENDSTEMLNLFKSKNLSNNEESKIINNNNKNIIKEYIHNNVLENVNAISNGLLPS